MRQIALLAATLVLLFANSFGLHRAGDDWLAVAFAMDAVATGEPYAQITQPFTHHWSPLWYAFEIANYQLVGWHSDTLIRVFVMVCVLLSVIAFVWIARRLGLSPTSISVGIAVLLLHPIAAAAYYSFDCYSHVAADTLVWSSTALLISVGVGLSDRRAAATAVVLFVVALLFKEQALAGALNALIIALWFRHRTVGVAAGAMVAVSVVFAFARAGAGLWFETEGPFAMCVACVPANVATLVAGSLIPVPASDVYIAFREGNWLAPSLIFGSIALISTATLLGLGVAKWHRARRPHAALIVLLLLAATFPVAILADIGELYTHSLLFWLAILAAMAWDAAAPPLLFAEGFAFVLLIGLFFNLADMRATGHRAAGTLAATHAALATVPADAGIVLHGFDETPSSHEYGLIRIHAPGRLILYGVALDVTAPGRRRFDTDEEARAWQRETGGAVYALVTNGSIVRAMPLSTP
jgi:hypothetical protein